MSEQDFNILFSKNLNYYLNKNDKTQLDLANHLKVSTSAVSAWCRGVKTPRMDKVDAMCKYFGIRRSDLMEDKDPEAGYYFNEETAKAAQEIFENKDLRMLFDATRDADPEDLKALHSMALALKRKERGNSDDTGC